MTTSDYAEDSTNQMGCVFSMIEGRLPVLIFSERRPNKLLENQGDITCFI